MKHPLLLFLAGCAFLTGCAASEQNHQQERMLEMNERRIDTVEKNITALNEQVAMLNNRVYEVRGYKGKKTGMTVVPVVAAPSPTTQPTAQSGQQVPTAQPNQVQPQNHVALYSNQPVASNKPGAVRHPSPQKAKQTKKRDDDKRVKNASKPSYQNREVASLPPQSASGVLTLPPAETTSPQMVQAQEQGVLGLPPTLPMESQSPALPQEHATVRTAPNQPSYASTPQSRQPVAQRATAGEEASYKQALQLVRRGRSQEGIQKFNEYLSRYPNGKYAPNAEYWIGECYYSQGKYREALGKYESVNAKYPSHHKNADALLKSGMTYSRLGDSSNAKAKYSQLQQNFPQSEAARRARSGR